MKGNKTRYVRSERRIIESFRQSGPHAPEAVAFSCEVISLGEAATNLMNDAIIRVFFFFDNGYSECDNIDSMPSGSMSLDLGDTWHQGLPMSPQWEGELELDLNSASDLSQGQ